MRSSERTGDDERRPERRRDDVPSAHAGETCSEPGQRLQHRGSSAARARTGRGTSDGKSSGMSARSTSLGHHAAGWIERCTLVASSSSMRSAGRTSTCRWATFAPALPNQCGVPEGTRSVMPGQARTARRASRNRTRPARTVKRSSCRGCACAAGTCAPGCRKRSKARSWPCSLGATLADDNPLATASVVDHAKHAQATIGRHGLQRGCASALQPGSGQFSVRV